MKETYFFYHDYNARQDPKMQEVLMDLGVAGLGIFWCIIEQLYEQGGRIPLSSIKAIAFALHVNIDEVRSLVENYQLFENDSTYFWSPAVERRLDERRKLSEKRSKAIAKRWANDTKMQKTDTKVSDNDTSVLQKTQNAPLCNTIKENKIKGKEIKENSICIGGASEREKILYIFFFEKNFINPNEEVERFINHYEANGWCRNNSSVPVKDKMALARAWKPQKEGIRFPQYFNQWLSEVYWQAVTNEPDNAGQIMQVARCEEMGNFNITLYCTRAQAELIERNIVPIERNIVPSNLFKLSYRIKN